MGTSSGKFIMREPFIAAGIIDKTSWSVGKCTLWTPDTESCGRLCLFLMICIPTPCVENDATPKLKHTTSFTYCFLFYFREILGSFALCTHKNDLCHWSPSSERLALILHWKSTWRDVFKHPFPNYVINCEAPRA